MTNPVIQSGTISHIDNDKTVLSYETIASHEIIWIDEKNVHIFTDWWFTFAVNQHALN